MKQHAVNTPKLNVLLEHCHGFKGSVQVTYCSQPGLTSSALLGLPFPAGSLPGLAKRDAAENYRGGLFLTTLFPCSVVPPSPQLLASGPATGIERLILWCCYSLASQLFHHLYNQAPVAKSEITGMDCLPVWTLTQDGQTHWMGCSFFVIKHVTVNTLKADSSSPSVSSVQISRKLHKTCL